jgi:hypothetical protein
MRNPVNTRHMRGISLKPASKYGGGYFVTNDRRMINKRQELAEVLPPSLNIVTLEEFLRTFDDFETNRRI